MKFAELNTLLNAKFFHFEQGDAAGPTREEYIFTGTAAVICQTGNKTLTRYRVRGLHCADGVNITEHYFLLVLVVTPGSENAWYIGDPQVSELVDSVRPDAA